MKKGQQALFSMKDFSRVHDVVRVQGLLQGAHHVDGADARFCDQEIYFVQANAMLASAGAAEAQGAAHELVIQVLCNLALTWDFRVNQIAKVKIAITDVSD